jgi:dTDP-4-amino-4,6-dideoxygalactose transaminase
MSLIEPRPAVLSGGIAIVSPPHPFRVTWDGDEPRVSPRVPGAPWEPQWPIPGTKEATGVLQLILSGEPLGYLGARERKLERRVARLAGPGTFVRTCSTGTTALEIAYPAVMTAAELRGKRVSGTPEFITTTVSFQATFTKLVSSGFKPVFGDVSPTTGCLEVAGAERYLTENTVGVVVTVLYDHCPDLKAWRQFCDEHDLFLVVDGAHAPFATWEGQHATLWADVFTTSNQTSKIWTTGFEGGFVMTGDRVLAALVTMMRNCGRRPDPLPSWWPPQNVLPKDFRVSGDNHRGDEIRAVILDIALDRYLDEAPRREQQVALLREFLAARPELPWSLLPEQPEFTGGPYKVALLYEEGPWGLSRKAVAHWLSRELTTEVAKSYALPWEPESGFHPQSRPWAWRHLVPKMDPVDFPNATRYVEQAQLLPHEFFLRANAADQLGRALMKLERWHEDPEVVAWAEQVT